VGEDENDDASGHGGLLRTLQASNMLSWNPVVKGYGRRSTDGYGHLAMVRRADPRPANVGKRRHSASARLGAGPPRAHTIDFSGRGAEVRSSPVNPTNHQRTGGDCALL